jgi:hypothetical protein
MNTPVAAAVLGFALASPAAASDREGPNAFAMACRTHEGDESCEMRFRSPKPHRELLRRFPTLRGRWFEKHRNHPEFGNRFWGEDRDEALKAEASAKEDVEDLLEKYHETESDKDRKAVRRKIRDRLAEVFDMRIEREREHARALEKKIEKLRRRIDKRKRAKDEIVEKRLRELAGDATDSDLDWF